MRVGPRPLHATTKSGYALPAVLAVLSVLTLVFITALSALQSLAAETRASVDAADFLRIAYTAEAHAAYLSLTEPLAQNRFRVGGLRVPTAADQDLGPILGSPSTPLFIDDRAYGWSNPTLSLSVSSSSPTPPRYLISLQDGAGLMNLDYSRQDSLQRLFIRAGADNSQAATLADELLDYIDVDDSRRPNGAEAADYAAAGRPAPPNTPMNRLDQVFGILDWGKVMTEARWRRIADLVVADPSIAAFNINTAPQAVLEVVLNLPPDRASAIVAGRETTPINSITQIGLPEGDGTVSYVFPDGSFRFTLRDQSSGLAYRSYFALTPENLQRPIWVENGAEVRLAPVSRSTTDGVPAFPDPLGRPAGA